MKTYQLVKTMLLVTLLTASFNTPSFAQSTATDAGIDSDAGAAYEQALLDVENNRGGVIMGIIDRWRSTMDALDHTEGWDKELTAALETTTTEKLLAASQATTYDGVVEALIGRSQVPDVIVLGEGISPPATLGSTSNDLVFTPITPCRIIDTRFATGGFAGRIGPDSGKQFQVNLSDFTAQGGSAAGCGMPSFEVSAVSINVTSVNQTGNGNLAVIESGGGVPNVSLVNYKIGTNSANAGVVRSATFAGDDIYIRSNISASHVVVDIMGYYSAPEATILDNYTVVSAITDVVAGSNLSLTSPTCPAGYRVTGGGHSYSTFNPNVTVISSRPSPISAGPNVATAWLVQVVNSGGVDEGMRSYAICSRVPGR